MSVRTPEPRIPLEPEEYPLYKPPRRIGCSALTVITLLTALAFVFLLANVTPKLAKAIVDIPRGLFKATDATPDTTPGSASSLATQTAIAPVPVLSPGAIPPTAAQVHPTVAATLAPIATPTESVEYVRVANTGGSGVKFRSKPDATSRYPTTVAEDTVLKVVGPDVTDPKASIGVWREVQILPPGKYSGTTGYVQAKYLVPAPAPNK
ncbi:MAG: hypothetical protein M3014_03020 [Chloroflexota bacterium]|nr:hypothetical protein [Chloroflexota bacterium]